MKRELIVGILSTAIGAAIVFALSACSSRYDEMIAAERASSEAAARLPSYEERMAEFPSVEEMLADYKERRATEDRRRRVDAIAANDWTDEINTVIMGGRVRVGMTTDQVRASWGEPTRYSRSRSAGPTYETWRFDADRFWSFYFEEGVLVRMVDMD